jgi:hypothetical protein
MGLMLNLIRSLGWTLGSYTPTKTFDPATADLATTKQALATVIAELDRSNLFDGPTVENAAPVNTAAPSITGTSSVGSTLTATTGTWTGTPTPTLSGQWCRGSTPISGATGATYTVVSGDVGSVLKYRQTATNVAGSASADSNGITATTASTWILADGTWNDAGTWDDDAVWNDGSTASGAANYVDRVATAGGSVTGDGLAVVEEIYAAAADNNATVGSSWLFGNAANVSKNRLLNIVEGKPDLVPTATLHADTVQTNGMVGLRITDANQGYKTADNSAFFTNPGSSPYSVLFLYQNVGDPVDADPYYYEATGNLFTQGGIRAAGNHQFIQGPNSQFTSAGGGNGGNENTRELQMDTGFCWVHFDGNGNWCAYHCQQSGGTPVALSGSVEGAFDLCSTTYQVPTNFALIGILRFDGNLTSQNRKNIFDRVWGKLRATVTACLVVGNSVTISGVTDPRWTWPRRLNRWFLFNNGICIRRAAGAQRLPKFAPVGYSLPAGANVDTDIATMSISLVDYFAANLFINDDQQNMVGSGQPYFVWLHCHNAFTAHLQAMNEHAVRAVICTQMAHSPYTFGSPPSGHVFLPYPAYGNSNWRQVSIATRAETLAGYNNIKTTYADVWTAFNLGYPTEVDGTPFDPLNDFGNGDVNLFATNDAQHPSEAGHVVMYNLYKSAVEQVLAL